MQMRRLDDVRRYKTDSLNYPGDDQVISFKGNRLSGELTLKDVNFGYSPLDPPLIEHFDLHLEPGRWAAVVGSSGSGKSTLAKLVAGLYEEWSGEVLFDGNPAARHCEFPGIRGSGCVPDYRDSTGKYYHV